MRAHAPAVTITGPPGVGKTRLAIELAHELAAAHRDGAYFVDLAPLRQADDVPPTIAQALHLEPRRRPSDVLDQLRRFLSPRNLLLVLDNREHLPALGPVIDDLIAGAPDLRLVLTSRRRLALECEDHYPVAPLRDADAIVLFAEHAQSVSASFRASRSRTPPSRSDAI